MSEGVAVTAIVVILLYAWFAEYIGEVALITGAFIAGIFLRPTDVHSIIDDKLRSIAYALFVPIFFVGVGLSADAGDLAAADVGLLVAIFAVAVVSKVAGCGLGAYLAGERPQSALQIGTGMVSRGEVGLIVASVGLSHELIQTDVYAVMVFMVLATTLATPVLLQAVFSRSRGGVV
jgi:Kef-type K+ transport system membrane component KefB